MRSLNSALNNSCFAGLTSCFSGGQGEDINENWRIQAALSEKTYKKFGDARAKAEAEADAAGLHEVVVDNKHFEELRSGHWFIIQNIFNKVPHDFAVMQDGTNTSTHPKAHLRTIDFILESGAHLEIVNE